MAVARPSGQTAGLVGALRGRAPSGGCGRAVPVAGTGARPLSPARARSPGLPPTQPVVVLLDRSRAPSPPQRHAQTDDALQMLPTAARAASPPRSQLQSGHCLAVPLRPPLQVWGRPRPASWVAPASASYSQASSMEQRSGGFMYSELATSPSQSSADLQVVQSPSQSSRQLLLAGKDMSTARSGADGTRALLVEKECATATASPSSSAPLSRSTPKLQVMSDDVPLRFEELLHDPFAYASATASLFGMLQPSLKDLAESRKSTSNGRLATARSSQKGSPKGCLRPEEAPRSNTKRGSGQPLDWEALQKQNEELARQVQALENAKSLAAVQSSQALKKIRSRQGDPWVDPMTSTGPAESKDLSSSLMPHEAAWKLGSPPSEPLLSSPSASSWKLPEDGSVANTNHRMIDLTSNGNYNKTSGLHPDQGGGSAQNANQVTPPDVAEPVLTNPGFLEASFGPSGASAGHWVGSAAAQQQQQQQQQQQSVPPQPPVDEIEVAWRETAVPAPIADTAQLTIASQAPPVASFGGAPQVDEITATTRGMIAAQHCPGQLPAFLQPPPVSVAPAPETAVAVAVAEPSPGQYMEAVGNSVGLACNWQLPDIKEGAQPHLLDGTGLPIGEEHGPVGHVRSMPSEAAGAPVHDDMGRQQYPPTPQPEIQQWPPVACGGACCSQCFTPPPPCGQPVEAMTDSVGCMQLTPNSFNGTLTMTTGMDGDGVMVNQAAVAGSSFVQPAADAKPSGLPRPEGLAGKASARIGAVARAVGSTATPPRSRASASSGPASVAGSSRRPSVDQEQSEQLQVELEGCLDTIQWCAESVTRESLQDLKSITRPAPIVKDVLEAVSHLVGSPESRWDKLKRLIGMQSFLEKIQRLNFQQNVSREQFRKLREFLQQPDFDEELIKSVCVPVVPLATWCRAIGVYLSKTKFQGGPEIRPVAAAAADNRLSDQDSILNGDHLMALTEMVFEPDLAHLSEQQLRSVENLTISRPNIGTIIFHGKTDCSELDFERIVRLEIGEVLVYPEASLKPPVGVGLNKPATVTMFQCWPPNGGRLLQDPRSQERYKKKIKQMTEEKKARFIDYDCNTGVWQFSVDHF